MCRDGFPKLQLLQASADEDDDSEFRVLVDSKSIKYITIDPGLYDTDDLCFEPTFVALLPRPLPSGDWNEARISRDLATGQPHFKSAVRSDLPMVSSLWHPIQVDYLDLQIGKKLHSGLYEAKCPSQFPSHTTIVVKIACFPWQIGWLEDETSAYELLKDHNIGPKFLGHVSEEGRVIGFIIEHIANARHAEDTPHDLALCQQALGNLHQLGIKHGDVNKHNFLIHQDQQRSGTECVTLIDFSTTVKCDEEAVLKGEMDTLAAELRSTDGRGGVTIET